MKKTRDTEKTDKSKTEPTKPVSDGQSSRRATYAVKHGRDRRPSQYSAQQTDNMPHFDPGLG